MRSGPNNRRPMRRGGGGNNNNSGNSGRRGGSSRTQNFESNGPDIRVRGNAQQIVDKYKTLAREAATAGNPVMAENYYQHAEHYHRVITAAGGGENRQNNRQPESEDRSGSNGAESNQRQANGQSADDQASAAVMGSPEIATSAEVTASSGVVASPEIVETAQVPVDEPAAEKAEKSGRRRSPRSVRLAEDTESVEALPDEVAIESIPEPTPEPAPEPAPEPTMAQPGVESAEEVIKTAS